jgi:hypothetical protein
MSDDQTRVIAVIDSSIKHYQPIDWFITYSQHFPGYVSKITEMSFCLGDLSGKSLEFLKRCTSLTHLTFNNQLNLWEIPSVVWELQNIESLVCRSSTIKRIPAELALLPKLKNYEGSVLQYGLVPKICQTFDILKRHCQSRLWRRGLTVYAFIAIDCPQPVVEALDIAFESIFLSFLTTTL